MAYKSAFDFVEFSSFDLVSSNLHHVQEKHNSNKRLDAAVARQQSEPLATGLGANLPSNHEDIQ